MPGKLIVLDGLDGSGKSTQAARVFDALREKEEHTLLISFPDYAQPSSTLVRMYLDGDFSDCPDEVNAYAASSFYAVDRYASYLLHWREQYEAGWMILATRYTTSNAVHQMAKLPESEWESYLAWLEDYEYNKLGLPRPGRVLFLDMPRAVAEELAVSRAEQGGKQLDIHEKDESYLKRCEDTARYAAGRLGWELIPCAAGGCPLPVEAVTAQILEKIEEA